MDEEDSDPLQFTCPNCGSSSAQQIQKTHIMWKIREIHKDEGNLVYSTSCINGDDAETVGYGCRNCGEEWKFEEFITYCK